MKFGEISLVADSTSSLHVVRFIVVFRGHRPPPLSVIEYLCHSDPALRYLVSNHAFDTKFIDYKVQIIFRLTEEEYAEYLMVNS